MKWIKTSKANPSEGNLYFVKIKVKDSKEDWFPATKNFYGEWEIDEMYEVTEWLDESAAPDTVQGQEDGREYKEALAAIKALAFADHSSVEYNMEQIRKILNEYYGL